MIEQSLFIALSILAIWACLWSNMIFGKVGDFIRQKLPEWLSMPLAECPICATMWYGPVLYILKYGLDDNIFFVLLMAMGWNTLVVKFLPENWYNQQD